MNRSNLSLVCLIGLFVLAVDGMAQNENPAPPPPEQVAVLSPAVHPIVSQTRLEAFSLRKGAIIIRGYTDAGTLSGDDGSTVRVLAVEMKDLSKADHTAGVVLQVTSRAGRMAESFLDANELDGLIASADQMRQLDRTTTAMTSFEARYRTQGGLEIANIDVNGARIGEIRSTQILWTTGEVIWATSHIRASRLEELRRMLVSAKEKLPAIAAPLPAAEK